MNLFPKTPQFFPLFIKLAQLNLQASTLLTDASPGHKKLKSISEQVQELENESDTMFHTIREESDKTFITPIDREDIYALGKHLNAIVDYIENVTTSIYLFKLTGGHEDLKEYTLLIHQAASHFVDVITMLSHQGKYVEKMKKTLTLVYKLERDGDTAIRHSYAKLFTSKKNGTTVVAWKHIYDNLELILDECEATADTINDIILKNY